jgi:D-lactate dehydrogenase
VEEEVDRCIECGYCEHKCPSRDITTTPRRRIVLRRVLQDLKSKGDIANYDLLLRQYQYDGIDTCAVDGLCATACPVDINTGDLVKRLRRENHSSSANNIALFIAKNFGATVTAVRMALNFGTGINRIFGLGTMNKFTRGVRKILPSVPLWSQQLTSAPSIRMLEDTQNHNSASIVYFPSCISRTMGTYAGEPKNAIETFLSVCKKAEIGVKIIENVNNTCCSQIFSSKGFSKAYQHTANNIVDQLFHSTREGFLPVVIDVSSCAYTLHQLRPVLSNENKTKFDKLKILDAVDFLHDMIVPNVIAKNKLDSVVLHPVCSLQKMKTENKFVRIAQAFAVNVTVPENAGCCGMAGDRGFLFPELTDSATHHEGSEVRGQKFSGYYSSTKTCEMALAEATNENYKSILYLVDKCT